MDPELIATRNTPTAYAHDLSRSVHELFEQQVARTPDRCAVSFEAHSLSYAELSRRSSRLASRLRALGAGPDKLVAICTERSLDMVIGLLGILKSAAAFLPLEPDQPCDRLTYMLKDAAPAVLLATSATKHILPTANLPLLLIDQEICATPEAGHRTDTGECPRNLMYVMYTSGTTGHPKGVMIEHRSVVNRLLWMQSRYQLVVEYSVLQKTPYGFDVSVWELFLPLLVGARLVVARPHGHKDADYIAETIQQQKISVVHFVPSMLQIFLDRKRDEMLQSLRLVVCSGEELKTSLQGRFFDVLPDVRLCNLYGPTEAAIDVTAWDCAPHDTLERVPIGRPIWNTQLYVLDDRLSEAKAGASGEIYIGGIGLARGYLGKPALTADRFLADPFVRDPLARMYRTGDIGRFRPNGELEYLERRDHQVKIRGFRIELGEIEAHIMRHGGIKAAVTVAQDDAIGGKRLVAYVVPDVPKLKELHQTDLPESDKGLVGQWRRAYEERYSTGPCGPSFAGYNSSYDGQPISSDSMRIWVKNAVDRILELKPRKILDIGCGVGLLLEQLAPVCETYHATDISEEAIRNLRAWLATRPELQHVTTEQCSALETVANAQQYDTVVMNGVVMHFPNIEYLQALLEKAVAWVSPGGSIFIGDVRPLNLLRVFHTSVQLSKASSNVTVEQLRARIDQAVKLERDLLIDPTFFVQLPGKFPRVTRTTMLLKRGSADNEMIRYRYDVVLGIETLQAPAASDCINWTHRTALSELAARSESRHATAVSIRKIPNRRISLDVAATHAIENSEHVTVGEIRNRLTATNLPGEDPDDFYAAGESLGYKSSAVWESFCSDGTFRVHWCDPAHYPCSDLRPNIAESEARAHANDPWEAALRNSLPSLLTEHLKKCVPDYMVPVAIVVLDHLPLTSNGKLDRQALPAPIRVPTLGRETPTRWTPTEKALSEVWQQVLNLEEIGPDDNFFELGGHSLLGMRIVHIASERFYTEIPTLAVFQFPTIREMAQFIDAQLPRDQAQSMEETVGFDEYDI